MAPALNQYSPRWFDLFLPTDAVAPAGEVAFLLRQLGPAASGVTRAGFRLGLACANFSEATPPGPIIRACSWSTPARRRRRPVRPDVATSASS